MKKAIRPAIFKWRQTEPELILCACRASAGGAVFIPMFTRRLARSGESPARVFAGKVVSFAAAAVTALATLLPAGSVSFLHYDERVARLLPSVVGGAAATALLPHLSRHGGKGAASIHRKGSAEA